MPATLLEVPVVDPVYLALKQATGIYGRRSSSGFGDDTTPSPRNLSQGSLQDSGFSEASYSAGSMVRSTPLLPQSGIGPSGRKRPPKLQKQMKSLSLDCAEPSPPIINTIRSNFTESKPGVNSASRLNSSGDLSDWGRSRSPSGPPSRSTPHRVCSPNTNQVQYIVVHEYYKDDVALRFGDAINVVDNGDPLWLHGYNLSNRKDRLICFPSHTVTTMQPGEQPMLTTQTIYSPEVKERIYRDTVVFAQPDTISEGRVLVRTEHNVFVRCPLQHVRLL
uniref:SH3 domain-containing protein n=1 Tax=Syphacia muris TaxID=451379 RepID=A0A0N5AYU0_9BILA